MARPSKEIIHTLSFDDGITIDILKAPGQYMLLYKGLPVSIRGSSVIGKTIKYYKTTWPHEGSARSKCLKLNKKFGCNDFTYVKVA
jgi:hypothetical protein